jgi:hypothetical protein
MEPVSRRQFFKHAGSAAAIAVVAGGAISPLGLAGAGASTLSGREGRDEETPLEAHEELSKDESLVAHVKNSRTGEISLFIGQREVTLNDRKVAARLIRAAR